MGYIFFLFNIFLFIYLSKYETIEILARAFLTHNVLPIGTVTMQLILNFLTEKSDEQQKFQEFEQRMWCWDHKKLTFYIFVF